MAESRAHALSGRDVLAGLTLGAAGAAIALAPDWRIPLFVLSALGLAFIAAWMLGKPYRWFAVFTVLALLVPPLPFAVGSTGPHVAAIAAAVGICGLLARNPPLRLPSSSIGLPALAYLFVLALSAGPALWISGPGPAAGSLTRTGLFAIAIVAYLAIRHGSTDIDVVQWTRGLLVLGFLTAFIGCVDFTLQLEPVSDYGVQMVWLPGEVVRRAQGVFYDSAQFGNVCAFFLIGTAAVALQRRTARPLPAPALALIGVTLIAALVFSFSRASMLNAAVGLAVLAVLERSAWAGRGRVIAGAAAVALAASGVVFVAAPEFTSSYVLRFVYTAWRAVADPAEALGVRLESWSRLLEMLAEHPARLLLGAGYKTLGAGAATETPLIVDNQWLTALGEIGLIGLIALVFFLIAILRGSWRAALSPSSSAALLGVWSFCFWAGQLVQMLFVDLMTYWRVLPIYFAVLALAEKQAAQRTV